MLSWLLVEVWTSFDCVVFGFAYEAGLAVMILTCVCACVF